MITSVENLVNNEHRNQHWFKQLKMSHLKMFFCACIKVFFIITSFTLFNSTSANTEFTTTESTHNKHIKGQISVGELLLKIDIPMELDELNATINIKQRFKSDSDDWVNGRYVFPLLENTVVDQKKYDHHVLSLRLPTALTHRYFARKALKLHIKKNQEENQHVQINHHSGWRANTSIISNAANFTPSQTHAKNTQTPNNLSLKLTLNASIEHEHTHSEIHHLLIKNTENTQDVSGKGSVTLLKNNTTHIDHDLV